MKTLVILISGVAIVIIIKFWNFFNAIRSIAVTPKIVHMMIGQTVNINAVCYRKDAWSFSVTASTNPRNVTFTNAGAAVITFPGASPAVVGTNPAGLATIAITGFMSGKTTIRVKAPSSVAGKNYGPEDIEVYVYTEGNIPAGVVLTQ